MSVDFLTQSRATPEGIGNGPAVISVMEQRQAEMEEQLSRIFVFY